jgi:hypothetical protein
MSSRDKVALPAKLPFQILRSWTEYTMKKRIEPSIADLDDWLTVEVKCLDKTERAKKRNPSKADEPAVKKESKASRPKVTTISHVHVTPAETKTDPAATATFLLHARRSNGCLFHNRCSLAGVYNLCCCGMFCWKDCMWASNSFSKSALSCASSSSLKMGHWLTTWDVVNQHQGMKHGT